MGGRSKAALRGTWGHLHTREDNSSGQKLSLTHVDSVRPTYCPESPVPLNTKHQTNGGWAADLLTPGHSRTNLPLRTRSPLPPGWAPA